MTAVATTLSDIIVFAYRTTLTGGGTGSGSNGEYGAPDISREEALEQQTLTFTPSCGQLSTIENRIDATFVGDREGGSHSSGYIPKDAAGNPIGNSGVTVGVGIDLGARNVNDLRSMGLANPLINILTPYLGLKGAAAQAYLDAHPLTLTPTAENTLNRQAYTQLYSDLYLNYNSRSNFNFWRLPAAAQTVLASVATQYGPNLHKPGVAPIFFAAMVEGRWGDAVAELRNFGDEYGPRRNLEANELEEAIDAGELPNSC